MFATRVSPERACAYSDSSSSSPASFSSRSSSSSRVPSGFFLRSGVVLCSSFAPGCVACCFATKRGIRVCAPVHDALLIEAPLDDIDAAVAETQRCMEVASAVVLDGFRLRSDAQIVRHPARYQDKRGKRMWETVWRIVGEMKQTEATPNAA